ncbi:MAG TPA: hypothetical protein DEO84_04315 [candidate division Zixibacteria bacterium]|jgi:hypothetical protein|nr:hypothetical protein [candidate division Zixibacteria bacterium]HBZ00529.1 hypothetical protein [candidate division Zixibacteria bacterium]
MKSIVLILTLILVCSTSSYSQVETLTANEIGTIIIPGPIRQFYIQNLDQDSQNEIILCSADRVYVYRSGNDQPLWVSPVLVRPGNLQFSDINNDDLIDISVQDSANISLFNPHDSTLINSIPISGLFRCYAMGDANNDGIVDLAIARQESFDASVRQDSVWIDYYYGPDFTNQNQSIFTIENYYVHGHGSDRITQSVDKVVITEVGYNSFLVPRIFLISNVIHVSYDPETMSAFTTTYGGYWTIDPQTLQIVSNRNYGKCDTIGFINTQDASLAFCASSYLYLDQLSDDTVYSLYKFLSKFNSAGFFDSTQLIIDWGETILLNIPSWTLIVGELDSSHVGPELSFGFRDSLYEYSVLYGYRLWATLVPADSFSIKGVLHSNTLFQKPELLIKEIRPIARYLFIDGMTHELNAILPDTTFDFSQIADINSDGQDELLSISSNIIRIYSLARITGLTESPTKPVLLRLPSNYPNPFNSQTTISFDLPKGGDAKIEIFDIRGCKIDLLEMHGLKAWNNQVTWDASSKSSGLYFYRICYENQFQEGRMVLIK